MKTLMILSLLLGVVVVGQTPRKALNDDEWHLIARTVYKCGQITADAEWIRVIDASKSTVTFTIDRTKSARDWTANHCDDALHIAQVTK